MLRRGSGQVSKVVGVLVLAVLVLGAVAAGWSMWSSEVADATSAPSLISDEPLDLTPPPTLAVLGDSYTQGSPMGGYNGQNWPIQSCIEDGCGYDDHFAVGGSGFTVAGNDKTTFLDRVSPLIASKPDLVIVAGGANDAQATPEQFAAAAEQVISRLAAGLPHARIVVLSPFWRESPGPEVVYRMRDQLRTIAERQGLRFVDVTDLFDAKHADLIGEDGVHPTDEGHDYMTRKLAPVVQSMLPADSSS